jgi:hypothetical protein
MDSKKAEVLRKKYWEGKTSQSEEKELKNHFSGVQGGSDLDEVYFSYLDKKSGESPLDDKFDEEILSLIDDKNHEIKQNISLLKYWYIAASLLLIISVSIIFKNEIFKVGSQEQVVQADTFEDPEKAFEETKKALLLLSSMLNQSDEYTTQFSKFDESQTILKQN